MRRRESSTSSWHPSPRPGATELAKRAQAEELPASLQSTRAVPYAMLCWLKSLPSPCHAAVVSLGTHEAPQLPGAAMWGAARSARLERPVPRAVYATIRFN